MKKKVGYFLIFIWALCVIDLVNRGQGDILAADIGEQGVIIILADKKNVSAEFEKFRTIFSQELKRNVEIEGDTLPAGRYRVYLKEIKGEFGRIARILLEKEMVCQIEIVDLKTRGNMELFAKESVKKILQMIKDTEKEEPSPPPIFKINRPQTTIV